MLSVNNNATTIAFQFLIAQICFLIDSWIFYIKSTAEHITIEEFKQNKESSNTDYFTQLWQNYGYPTEVKATN